MIKPKKQINKVEMVKIDNDKKTDINKINSDFFIIICLLIDS